MHVCVVQISHVCVVRSREHHRHRLHRPSCRSERRVHAQRETQTQTQRREARKADVKSRRRTRRLGAKWEVRLGLEEGSDEESDEEWLKKRAREQERG